MSKTLGQPVGLPSSCPALVLIPTASRSELFQKIPQPSMEEVFSFLQDLKKEIVFQIQPKASCDFSHSSETSLGGNSKQNFQENYFL